MSFTLSLTRIQVAASQRHRCSTVNGGERYVFVPQVKRDGKERHPICSSLGGGSGHSSGPLTNSMIAKKERQPYVDISDGWQ